MPATEEFRNQTGGVTAAIGMAFEYVGIDLVGTLPFSLPSKRWIVTAVDHVSRHAAAAAFPSATAEDVSHFLSQTYWYVMVHLLCS